MDELAPVAADYIDEQDPTVNVAWKIENLPALDWALSRIADLEREVSENESIASQALDRIRLRTDKLNDRAMRGANFFRSKVAEFAQLNRPALLGGGKKKSREFVHGSVGWKKKSAGLEVTDREALLAWARGQPIELGLVRIKEEPDLKAIKAHAEKNALIPPGMADKEEPDELKIEVNQTGLVLKGSGNGTA